MMQRPQHILLPVNPLFIGLSFLVAFAFNLMPWGQWLFVPDFVAIVIVFWNLHQPRRVGISIAFVMGMFMDVAYATLLGENALAYTLLSYVSIMIHRRVLWFPVRTQAFFIFLLIFFMQAVQLVIRLLVSGQAPNYLHYFGASVVSALLWPLVNWLLLMPQRRVINRDDNRPI
jgi:rod shape-determining protein MreD